MAGKGNPNWIKGGPSPNPAGHPKNRAKQILLEALDAAQEKYGKHLIELAIEQAYKPKEGKDDRREILRKILPDLTEADLTSAGLSLADILAKCRGDK